MYLVAVRCNDLKSYLHAPSLSPERVCSTLPFTTVAPRHAIATGRHADVPAYTRDLYAALTAAMHSTAQLGPESSCSSAPTSSSLIVHAPAFYQYQRLRGVDPLGRDERAERGASLGCLFAVIAGADRLPQRSDRRCALVSRRRANALPRSGIVGAHLALHQLAGRERHCRSGDL